MASLLAAKNSGHGRRGGLLPLTLLLGICRAASGVSPGGASGERRRCVVDGTGPVCVVLLIRLRRTVGWLVGIVVHVTTADPAAPWDFPPGAI